MIGQSSSDNDPILYTSNGEPRSVEDIETIVRGLLVKIETQHSARPDHVSAQADINEILDTQSTWLRQAKADLSRRDPVDAINDAEALLDFAQRRLTSVFHGSHCPDTISR